MANDKLETSELYPRIEALIRAGRVGEAAHELRIIPLKKIARADYPRLAALCRRAGIPQLAARLLNPIVRRERGSNIDPPTPLELAEYAMSLALLGVVPEALSILSRIPPDKAPESLLFRAFALILEWRYEEAVPLLDRYLKYPVQEYQRLIANVNLAAGLVFCRKDDRAREHIAATLRQAASAGASRLLANTHEIAAQLELELGNISAARSSLSEAQRFLMASGSLDHFFIEKWSAICAFEETRSQDARREIMRVREEAGRKHYWETVRDVDRHLAVRGGSREHFVHLCFGTPLPDYRSRLMARIPDGLALPDSYVWAPGGSIGAEIGASFAFSGGAEGDSRSVIHGFLRALSVDFYRPFRPGFLFSRLFRDQYFDPRTSPHRIHELVRRARNWLKEQEIPLSIHQSGGEYRLGAESGFGIRVDFERKERSQLEASLDVLGHCFGLRPFSAQAASVALKTSGRTARRILAEAESGGAIELIGRYNTRLYRLREIARQDAAA